MQPDMPVETALRVYRRYLKLEPSHTEEYIAYLKSKVNPLHTDTHPDSDPQSLLLVFSTCRQYEQKGLSSMQRGALCCSTSLV